MPAGSRFRSGEERLPGDRFLDSQEAAFLLKRERRDTDPLFALLDRGVIRIGLSIQEQQADLRALMRRYRKRPMTLADACLVWLCEIHAAAEVLTLDRDFRIYRRHGNKVIRLRMPERRKGSTDLGKEP